MKYLILLFLGLGIFFGATDVLSSGIYTEDSNMLLPISAEYTPLDGTDAFATGELTIEFEEFVLGHEIVVFWANADGPLEGYSPVARVPVRGRRVSYTFPAGLSVPHGADRLMIHTALSGSLVCAQDAMAILLPTEKTAQKTGDAIFSFQVVSDTHVTVQTEHVYNTHFSAMLADIKEHDPDSAGIFIVGDITDHGNPEEYARFDDLYRSADIETPLFSSMGNHDLKYLSFDEAEALFLQFARLPDGSTPTDSSYTFELEGYRFVMLSSDIRAGTDCVLSDETLTWLEDTLADGYVPERPIFLFMHQPLGGTVAGSLSWQEWNGVRNDRRLRSLLSRYPEIIMFNGHSHRSLESDRTMYSADERLPNIFNTASVAYLSIGRLFHEEKIEGSQGYYIEVYEDAVLVKGRDFLTGEWISAAQFSVEVGGGANFNKKFR